MLSQHPLGRRYLFFQARQAALPTGHRLRLSRENRLFLGQLSVRDLVVSPHRRSRFSDLRQFTQTCRRNRVARMTKLRQPQPGLIRGRHTEASQLITQFQTLIHPPEGRSRVRGARRTDGLPSNPSRRATARPAAAEPESCQR